jgi:hypothetical protein
MAAQRTGEIVQLRVAQFDGGLLAVALRRTPVAGLRIAVARIGHAEPVDRRPRMLRRGRESPTRGFVAIGPARLVTPVCGTGSRSAAACSSSDAGCRSELSWSRSARC